MDSLEYNGTFYVDTKRDDDYIGIAFNYQSNRRFMLISWKQISQTFWKEVTSFARSGIQIQVVDSNSGPGRSLRNALWNSGNSHRQVGSNSSKTDTNLNKLA